jgi:NadR type nicotinamide-nucleotide adenylyltransferase
MEKNFAKNIRRIALIGPESSGKTTLCMQFAEYYKTVWVPEYARTFMENLNRAYTYEDVIHCAREQMKAEDDLAKTANRFLFCDTELINYKVWFEDVFKKIPEWLEEEITKRKYDLYLLTSPDLPWVHEAVRENPHRREYLFDLYKKELEKRNFVYSVISGNGESRIALAIRYIDSYFLSHG